MSPQRVVIVGGGFAGLNAARGLKRAPVEVTLVDRRNFHLFQPLLYQVATGSLSPGEISSPLRYVLKRQANARVWMGEVVGLDVAKRRVVLSDGAIDYDVLVLAGGATHHYFGHPEWAEFAPGLKSIEDATDIRHKILLAFEAAEREPDARRREAWLRFVVVGAGPTGVELAGALGEIANDTLRGDFRAIYPADAQILLLEAGDRVLPAYVPSLSAKAEHSLRRLGVTVRLNTAVTAVDADGVRVTCSGHEEHLAARTVLWAAGVEASPLAKLLVDATGATADRAGRVVVGSDLTVPGHPEIYVIGDMAHVEQDGKMLPGLAPVANAQGSYVARSIAARAAGGAAKPFRFCDKGTLATIGRAAAVADLGFVRFSGLLAWLAWVFIHIMYLVEFENRVLVLVQWAWYYVTRNRGARLITGANPLPLPISRDSDQQSAVSSQLSAERRVASDER
ncbi:MAG: NAD(P)/FAD-dependent oxidoreductase [Deltaproteobacteria bacterium]|nr:NAD(P)/FAD-dependent oxidoreductase [Deltaproteobacteria bacterium]